MFKFIYFNNNMQRSFSHRQPTQYETGQVQPITQFHPRPLQLQSQLPQPKNRPSSFAIPQKNTKQYLMKIHDQQQNLIARKCLGVRNDLLLDPTKKDTQRPLPENYRRIAPEKNKIEIESPMRVPYRRPNDMVASQFVSYQPMHSSDNKQKNTQIQGNSQHQKEMRKNGLFPEEGKSRLLRPMSSSVIVSSSSSDRNTQFKKNKMVFNMENPLHHKKNSSVNKIEFFASPLKHQQTSNCQQNSKFSGKKNSQAISLANIKKIKSSYIEENNRSSDYSSSELSSPATLKPKSIISLTKTDNLSRSIVFDQITPPAIHSKTQSTGFIRLQEVEEQIKKTQQRALSLDDFEIYDKVGKGAFGDVFLARDKKTGFLCALKTLSKKKIKSQNLQEQVMRQIKIQSYMNHRHLTGLYGIFDDSEKIYLIMEYMPDGSMPRSMKKIPQAEVSYLVKQVCLGLIALHQEQIIHRDIKPQNLLMNDGYVKIGDFGCSVFTQSERNTVVGCFSYISPEQLSNIPYDDKIDVWSVGILAYELLYGRPPFEQELMKMVGFESKRGTGDTETSCEGIQFPALIFPEGQSVSGEAHDFISNLLEENSGARMQIRQALKHRFIHKSQEWEREQLKKSGLE